MNHYSKMKEQGRCSQFLPLPSSLFRPHLDSAARTNKPKGSRARTFTDGSEPSTSSSCKKDSASLSHSLASESLREFPPTSTEINESSEEAGATPLDLVSQALAIVESSNDVFMSSWLESDAALSFTTLFGESFPNGPDPDHEASNNFKQ